jgi:signal transduction histidine kinase/ligand-binding sensor domain-containing protein
MHNSVEVVLRDGYGYVWVGTNYGLNRLDGYQTINYIHDPNDTTTISSNHIKDLFIDSEGGLWIGTIGGGLNKYNYETDDFTCFKPDSSFNSISGLNVSAINEDLNGNIWIGVIGRGVSKYNPHSNIFHHYGLDAFGSSEQRNTNISNIFRDEQGNMWVGFDFDRNGIYKIDVETDEVTFHGLEHEEGEYHSVGSVTAITQMADGTLLFTIWNGMLYKLNPETDKYIQLIHDKDFFKNAYLRAIEVDHNENIWIGTWDDGLFLLNKKFELVNHFTKSDNNLKGINSNSVRNLYIENKNLWVSYREQGMDMVSLEEKMFQQLLPHSSSEHKTISGTCFAKDNEGNIWIGSRGQGLWKHDPEKGTMKNYSSEYYPGLINNNILSINIDEEGIIWIGTDGSFVGSFNPKEEKFQFLPYHEDDWSSVFAIAETDSFLWCGTWGAGIKKINKYSRYYTTITFDDADQYNNSIFDIKQVEDHLWIANVGLGLIKYHIPTQKKEMLYKLPDFQNKFPEENLTNIHVDADGDLWLCSTGGGLVRFNPKNSEVKILTTGDGLSGNVIQGVIADNNQNLWIATNSGVTMYNKNSNQAQTFYTHNGLSHNHSSMSSIFFDDHRNTLYSGSSEGVDFCSTEEIIISNNTQKVLFTSLSIANKGVDFRTCGSLNAPVAMAKEIKLYHHQKYFTIGFSSMEFNPSFKSNYYYMLEGFADNWASSPHWHNEVQFTNLNPGKYTFRVKAANRDGIFNNEESSISIIVVPAWWQTVWFWLGIICFFIFIVVVVIWYRYRQMYKQQMKLKGLVEQRTKEIEKQKTELEIANKTKDKFLSIIGHDLRNPVSSIDQFNELLLLEHQNYSSEELVRFYRLLKKSSSHTLQLLDDLLIWAKAQSGEVTIEKQKISIDGMFEKITGLCEPIALAKRISVEYKHNTNLYAFADAFAIESVLRNLLTNAIKFSKKSSTVELDITKDGDDLIISVKDYGVGMDETQLEGLFRIEKIISREGTSGEKGTGMGLILSKEFVELNGGRIWVMSEPGQGSTFYFTVSKA